VLGGRTLRFGFAGSEYSLMLNVNAVGSLSIVVRGRGRGGGWHSRSCLVLSIHSPDDTDSGTPLSPIMAIRRLVWSSIILDPKVDCTAWIIFSPLSSVFHCSQCSWMVGWLVFTTLSAQTGYIVPQTFRICRLGPGTDI